MIRTAPVPFVQGVRELISALSAAARMGREQRQRFNHAHARARLKRLVATAGCAVLLFNVFLLSDRELIPDAFALSLTSHLFILTPVVLTLVAIGHFAEDWWLRRVPPWVSEFNATWGTMAVASALCLNMWHTHSPHWAVYHSGLVPLLVFANLVQRLRFRYALVATLYIVLLPVVVIHAVGDRPSPYLGLTNSVTLLLAVIGLYTLVSNFNLEMDERRSFLQAERARNLRAQLEQTQIHLQAMSRLDALTGLPNRRQFNDYLAAQLSASEQGRPLSVLLIDVDHFKAFNDRYGHPAGDQCLRLVAAALNVTMRGLPGLVARWGGEEFAAVLPGVDAHTAQQLGHSMVRMVRAMAMRHEDSPSAQHVSVSCGVASNPAASYVRDIDQLLQQADAALYAAKASGRNCSMFSPPVATPPLAR